MVTKAAMAWAEKNPCARCGADVGEPCVVFSPGRPNFGKPLGSKYGWHANRMTQEDWYAFRANEKLLDDEKKAVVATVQQYKQSKPTLSPATKREVKKLISDMLIVLAKALEALEND